MGRKICILGTSAPSLRDVPKDAGWEYWVLAWRHDIASLGEDMIKRVSAWFEIHPTAQWSYAAIDEAKYVAMMKDKQALGGRIILAEAHKDLPNATVIDWKALCELITPGVPVEQSQVPSSSVSAMVAQAIWEHKQGAKAWKVDEIAFHGVDMVLESEYGYQKPGTLMMMGYARGCGIKVTVSAHSGLERTSYFYPSATHQIHERDSGAITLPFLQARINDYTVKHKAALGEYQALDGAAKEVMTVLKSLTAGQLTADKLEERLKQLVTSQESYMNEARTLDGALQEAEQLKIYVQHYLKGGVNDPSQSHAQ